MARALGLANLMDHQIGGRRNIIHNGAFTVDQRATAVTFTNGTTKTVDRWRASSANLDQATVVMQQSTTVPSGAGFGNSLQFNVTGAETSLDADEFLWVGQFIEGQNLQHLAHNTSSAKKITLSFWVRSHVAGDYGILFFKPNATRGYTTSYTVNAVDTWEYKTITIDGDTSGAILNDNSTQLNIYFALAMGSDGKGGGTAAWSAYSGNQFTISAQTNILSATGSWYITGVQLEVGEAATPFEHRSYGEELALCQRYYIQTPSFSAQKRMFNDGGATKALCVSGDFPVTMRASPSITVYGDVADASQITLGAQGGYSTTYGFSVFTSVYSGGFVDMHYYIADAEL